MEVKVVVELQLGMEEVYLLALPRPAVRQAESSQPCPSVRPPGMLTTDFCYYQNIKPSA